MILIMSYRICDKFFIWFGFLERVCVGMLLFDLWEIMMLYMIGYEMDIIVDVGFFLECK